MPRRSARVAKQKRVNYNEDALFYKMTKTKKGDWTEVEDTDPVPLYRDKSLYRKRLPNKKRVIKIPAKKKHLLKKGAAKRSGARGRPPARQVIDLTGDVIDLTDRDDEKLAVIEKDERQVDYAFESADERAKQIERMDRKVLKADPLTNNISRKRRQLLFINPGDGVLQRAIMSFLNRQQLPPWAKTFAKFLRYERVKGRLIWVEEGTRPLPLAFSFDKRQAVKRLYFDPREPSTIVPIATKLYRRWANISKANVTRILRSLETYQLNFGRRRPPDLKTRFFMRNPWMVVMDMFFPSTHLGWERTNVLCCADAWSRYCGVYVIDTKRKADVPKAMSDFLRDFAAMGHVPRRILCDKGSDMASAAQAIEQYRQQKDGNKTMVLHTATGTPVLLVEALNAEVQRRMQVFRTSGLIENVGQIAHEIANQINNQRRPDRGNLTPIQLLALDRAGRESINKLYKDRTVTAEIPGLVPLFVNDNVRLLKMKRKEQEQNKIKGFAPKWTKRLYTVIRKTALRKNEFAYRYDIGLPDTYYRHELLKVRDVDSEVPDKYVRYREVVYGGYDPADDEEWDHD